MAVKVTGLLRRELSSLLAAIHHQYRQREGYPYDPCQLKAALENAYLGKFGNLPKKETEKKPALFSIAAKTNLPELSAKKTSLCFTGLRWEDRDEDIDNWLPENQPATPDGPIITLVPSRIWTFPESAADMLGIGKETTAHVFGNLLIEQGCTITATQVEEMVEKTENSEETHLCTRVQGNFFFVRNNPKKIASLGPVSIGYVRRIERYWRAFLSKLEGGGHWGPGCRWLIPGNSLAAMKYIL